MARLEDLTTGARVSGLLPNETVTVVAVRWSDANAVELTYADSCGRPDNAVLYRFQEPELTIVAPGRAWAFDGDGEQLRLAAEARRIRLAHLFDPLLAVHTSLVDPLPHQITAVYGEMLPRQPLRFLLADDPGAGKTIMAGLFIKELLIRGDVQRCLIVSPGALVEQWQTELDQRFHLPFEILTSDKLEASRSGNWFQENPLAIARLDKLSRDEDVQAQLRATEWDLVIFDEAHKLSASFFAGEIRYTRRYRLAQLLGATARHLLLLTATPHNGKEEDFQLFLALLDADRFEGRFRDGVHTADVSDLMRRLTKEQLLTFEGTPLFPERIATTVPYVLSAEEHALYEQVSNYVRAEFNRADSLESGRKGTVGFALTSLQRRLASSPEAIFQSLRRRRERLEDRLADARQLRHGLEARLDLLGSLPRLHADDLDDLEDAPDAEHETIEEQLIDQATAARTVRELEAEIATLRVLEALAAQVRRGGRDRKWEELAGLLQNEATMREPAGHRRKLVIFTEHRDTLNYLTERIVTLLGRAEAVRVIHGAMERQARRQAEQAFKFDPDVAVLIATDAAGEGMNLQRAHLMVNYDLPWNPNRLEQRFGRIHRIGQTEVCHLWNLVAHETREGEVYTRLLQKLEVERKALGGQVFDVLGRLTFQNRSLRELLVEAVRYGDQPDVRARLSQAVETALDREQLRELLEERALAHDTMDASRVRAIREDLERAEARRLQPHFIGAFFLEAFRRLGGGLHERERGRYELTRVPHELRQPGRSSRGIVLPRYERATFEKGLRTVPGKPEADFLAPGHPLLDAVIDAVIARYGDLFRRGAILIDPADLGETPRVLLTIEHSIQDARPTAGGERRVISQRLQFVEIDPTGAANPAGYAPYLDYRGATVSERELLAPLLEEPWLAVDLDAQARRYAITHLVPEHLTEVKRRREELVTKTLSAVHERLTKEIIYWNSQAAKYRAQERAGKTPRMNASVAERRADELQERLRRRVEELGQERHITAQAPAVIGGALVVPAGLLARLLGEAPATGDGSTPEARRRIELAAMATVLQTERMLGFEPRDVSTAKVGYDIESRIPGTGRLRFVEVKGRAAGASTVTVSRNEILAALNKPDEFILALVAVAPDAGTPPVLRYVRRPFTREPEDFAESVVFAWDALLTRGTDPSDAH
jgi:superfamily II DNA or RNA helicase